MLDNADITPEQVPDHQVAERAINFLKNKCDVSFTIDMCEAIIMTYPTVDGDGESYPWTKEQVYEDLNNALNEVYNNHHKQEQAK